MDQNNMQGAIDEDGFDELDPNGLIGVIKIKDGLFICDELGAQVSEILSTIPTSYETNDSFSVLFTNFSPLFPHHSDLCCLSMNFANSSPALSLCAFE